MRSFILFQLFLLFLCASLPATASNVHWVRVEASATQLSAALRADPERIDYGRFQWLPVTDAQLATLRAGSARVTEVPEPFVLNLGGMRFDPLQSPPAPPRDWSQAYPAAKDWRLVQFSGPVKQAWLEQLRAAGLVPVQYIHPFTYVVWGAQEASQALVSRSNAIRWSGAFLTAYRVLPRWRSLNADVIDIHATVYRGADDVAAAMGAAGALVTGVRVVDDHFSSVALRVAGDRLDRLANIPGVYSLQPVPTDGGLRGEMSNQVNAGNIDPDNFAYPGYLGYLSDIGLDGSGVIMANVDGGIYDTHPDLVNNMLPCDGVTCGGSATDSHGTHTAGIMAADGASGVSTANGFLRGLGMAPGATLVEQLYSPFLNQAGGMLKLMTDSVRNGAIISGNSWGPSGSPQGYDDDTRQVDVGVRDADQNAPGDQPLVYVLSFMNGNGGFQSQGTPDEGKNMFTIGSTKMQSSPTEQDPNINDLSWNTAHGPALDGRTIPAMVAPGCQIDSADSATGYGLKCGTSMASPHVAGAAALFVEYYRGLSGGANPSPALVKAAFTAVAKDLTGFDDADGNVMTHPFNSKQGWGRMRVDPVLDPELAVVYVDQSTVFDNSGEIWSAHYTAADPSQPMRLMLAWTDAPGHGLGGSTPAWNNNLDLRVSSGADTWLGNVLGTDAWSMTGGSADPMNNTEAVFLQAAQHGGAIDVEVLASDINADGLPNDGDITDQDFALVCYNCLDAVMVDLVLTSTATPTMPAPGDPVSYAFDISNAGPGAVAELQAVMRATGLESLTLGPGAWSCGSLGTVILCHSDTAIAAGAVVPLTIEATVSADAVDPLTLEVSLSTDAADPDTSDNSLILNTPLLLDRIFANGFDNE